MSRNLEKNYNPKNFEKRIYGEWESKGLFKPKKRGNETPYTIIMPPPNITGQLHMGHALDQTIQDVLIRWKRMSGYSALWLPGSDHASIATEVKVVNRLKERNIEKEDIGREKFLQHAWEWKEEFGGKITRQCRELGDSCDWSRERFTMDEGCSHAVKTFFINLYKKGLIYRGERLINWCPNCGSVLSDIEVEHEEVKGSYWYFRYPGVDGSNGIVVATSRPETIFGDEAVAVNPNDERYKDLVGKKVVIPIVGREIPVIADEYPDPEKGSGAVKITPAHDPNDFEVGERHGLKRVSCINEDATMNALAGKYQGMDRYECRKAFVKDLEDRGYLVKKEELNIPVGKCYRCSTVVEPMLSKQWFVNMKPLAEPAIAAVKEGRVKFVPERFSKTYLHWMENIRDWCISRQLWWGHRIPAYYCDDCGEMMVVAQEPTSCTKCGGKNISRDEDVLDTWFSSALWPYSTLGWPEKTEDLDFYYPNNVLVTGYDIIFFWVARMIFTGIEAMGKEPFEYVYVHGLVRDSQGRKMSKSLGNGIDPLEVIEKYGADALRFMLITGISPGNDTRYQTERVEAARNFANKLWNASRFTIMNLQGENGELLEIADVDENSLRSEDKWIISRINSAVAEVKNDLDRFEIGMAGQKVHDVIWNEFCDWYIELVKNRLYGDDEKDKAVVRKVLVDSLKTLLKLLHPFMPFITEEIWQFLPGNDGGYLIEQEWPLFDESITYEEDSQIIEKAMEIIRAVRNIRAEAEASPSKNLSAVIAASKDVSETISRSLIYVKNLANITDIQLTDDKTGVPDESMSAVITDAEIFIPLDDLVDFEAELERLKKEKKKLEGEVKRAKGMLSNENFVKKAPESKVAEEKAKLSNYEDMLEKVSARMDMVEKKVK